MRAADFVNGLVRGGGTAMACDCADPQCLCGGDCDLWSSIVLFRVDMLDVDGTAFCETCAEDAMASGCFTEEEPVL